MLDFSLFLAEQISVGQDLSSVNYHVHSNRKIKPDYVGRVAAVP